jgi:hypothetical protein
MFSLDFFGAAIWVESLQTLFSVGTSMLASQPIFERHLRAQPFGRIGGANIVEAVGPVTDREKHVIVIENGPGGHIEDGGIGMAHQDNEWKGTGFVTVSKEFRT